MRFFINSFNKLMLKAGNLAIIGFFVLTKFSGQCIGELRKF
jgi:hypothetical protein